jgi:hypothetical protein
MRGIVYCSQASVPFSDAELRLLADAAAAHNQEVGVTGYLQFENGRFIQYIEGEGATVTALMESIARDRRHRILHVLYDEDVPMRRFPSWHMRWLQRSAFASIERLLGDYILLTKTLTLPDPGWEKSLWRVVNTLSSLKSRMPDH